MKCMSVMLPAIFWGYRSSDRGALQMKYDTIMQLGGGIGGGFGLHSVSTPSGKLLLICASLTQKWLIMRH